MGTWVISLTSLSLGPSSTPKLVFLVSWSGYKDFISESRNIFPGLTLQEVQWYASLHSAWVILKVSGP